MANVTTNFNAASLQSAAVAYQNGWSIPAAVNYGVAAYADLNFYSVQSFASISPNFLDAVLTNGDKVKLYGSSLTSFPAITNQVDYSFVKDNVTVSLFGEVRTASELAADTGYINKVKVSSVTNGNITIIGYDDVAVDGAGTISSVIADYNGVTLNVGGSISATTNIVAGDYETVLSGPVNSTSITVGGQTLQLSQINVILDKDYDTLDDFLKAALSSNDSIIGSSGNDLLVGYAGNDSLNGGAGIDTAVFHGVRSNFTVVSAGNGFSVAAKTGTEGSDSLTSVERLQFDNVNVAVDINGTAGVAYRIYQAAFNRKPDLPGLGYWINEFDKGASLTQVAASFFQSPEFKALYGSSAPDNTVLITNLYLNVLHRSLDQSGFDYWSNQLKTGAITQAGVLASFSESQENQLQVIAEIKNGIDYNPWLG